MGYIKRKAMTILLAIIFFFLFTSLLGFYTSVKPPRLLSDTTPKSLGLDYEEVSFTTEDNLTLLGWFIPRQGSADTEPAKTIILLHGYPADKGDILPSLAFLNTTYNLFLFDFRYLGKSDGKYSTAGAKETEDLLAAIRYLKTRGITEVSVWGFSMGGAVALMTAPHAPEIHAIVSESSYAQLNLLAPKLYRIPVLRYPLGTLTLFWARLFLGVDAKKVSPKGAASNLTIPILLIHSVNDEVIPFSHALLLKESLEDNPRAEFWFQENLIHGQLNRDYQKRVGDFYSRWK